MLQDVHRDLLCVSGNHAYPQSWVCVLPRWQEEKCPAHWPAHTSVPPGTPMSGLLLFWDARLVTTSPWDIVCHQQNGYEEGVNKVISAKKILKPRGDIRCHLNLKVVTLIISLYFLGGVTFSFLWTPSFCPPPTHVEFTYHFSHFWVWFLKLVWQYWFSSYKEDLDQGIPLPFTHLTFSFWLEAGLALRQTSTPMVSFERFQLYHSVSHIAMNLPSLDSFVSIRWQK